MAKGATKETKTGQSKHKRLPHDTTWQLIEYCNAKLPNLLGLHQIMTSFILTKWRIQKMHTLLISLYHYLIRNKLIGNSEIISKIFSSDTFDFQNKRSRWTVLEDELAATKCHRDQSNEQKTTLTNIGSGPEKFNTESLGNWQNTRFDKGSYLQFPLLGVKWNTPFGVHVISFLHRELLLHLPCKHLPLAQKLPCAA
jgi:hypothetical protein